MPSVGLQMANQSAVSALAVFWTFRTPSHLILPTTYAMGTLPREETDSEAERLAQNHVADELRTEPIPVTPRFFLCFCAAPPDTVPGDYNLN